ncbi:MAG TPA: nucleoside deaminase [Bacteroidales bacterium]|nr:nucleoside deaminase [Bacteroidales bacterium]
MEEERSFVLYAIRLADKGIADGAGPFGAVIVKDGKILAEAVNRVVINSDPTAHAEIVAIREAASLLKSHDLSDCTLYCSCEPCPMCLGAVYWSGIRKIVYASDRHDAEKAGFSDRYIYDEIILNPADRHISFIKIENAGGNEVFRKWNEHENRIQY